MADKPIMKQIDVDAWEPRVMVAPDGREWTPGSYVEERELSSLGYGFADDATATADADTSSEPTVAQTRVRTTAKKSTSTTGSGDGPAPATNVEPAQ